MHRAVKVGRCRKLVLYDLTIISDIGTDKIVNSACSTERNGFKTRCSICTIKFIRELQTILRL